MPRPPCSCPKGNLKSGLLSGQTEQGADFSDPLPTSAGKSLAFFGPPPVVNSLGAGEAEGDQRRDGGGGEAEGWGLS